MKKLFCCASFIIITVLFFTASGPVSATSQFGSYRWRADDGTEATANFSAPENAPLGRLSRNTPQRLRFAAGNDGTQSELLEKAATALQPGETFIASALVDTIHGYAYFGTFTTPAIVVKVRLGVGDVAPFRVGAITLATGENSIYRASVIDPANGYAYYGVSGDPAKVVKVRLGAGDTLPSEVGATPLDPGESALSTAVIDAAHGYAYFAPGSTATGSVVKISLGANDTLPARIGAVSFLAGEDTPLPSSAIDPANGYALFGTADSPAKIVKIALNGDLAPTRIGAVTLGAQENWPNTATGDPEHGYAYFGTSGSPAEVVKVAFGANINDPPFRVGALVLDPSEGGLYSSATDPMNGFAYFGVSGIPGEVLKVAFNGDAAPTRASALAFNSGENYPLSAVIDPANGYAYFETWDFVNPGRIVKVSIAPKAQFRLEYAPKVTTCSAIAAGWTQVPAAATTEAFQMYDSANLTDGALTTHVAGLTDLNTSFQSGRVKDTSSETASISLGEKQFTDLEYSIEATTDASAGTVYCFRLTNAGTVTPFSVANYAEATVLTGGSPAGAGGIVIAPPSVSLDIPNGGAAYAAGQQIGISWSSANGAFVSYRVSYSPDNGNTWNVLNTVSSASYTWTVPATSTTQGLIKVEGLDPNGNVLASAASASTFTVNGAAVAPPSVAPPATAPPTAPPAADPTVAGTYDSSTAKGNNPNFNTDMNLPAAAPFTAWCVSGTLIKSASLPAVYYCGADGKRYVFVNDKAYFSWYPDFSTVQIVPDSTLANIMIGGNITYRPGTRMVKIQSDPRTYVVARGGVLRWVETEAAAVRLFGISWNTMIDDVPDSFFVNYILGAPIAQ